MKSQRRPAHPSPARLFAEPEHHPQLSADSCIANVDGASRGNPGPAAYGVVLRRPDGEPLAELGASIGRATNNVAEYRGLIAALEYVAGQNIRRLRVRSDSELLVRQMQGKYKVKSADLRPLYERAGELVRGLEYFAIERVPREQNARADQLANEALDDAGSRIRPKPLVTPNSRETSHPAAPRQGSGETRSGPSSPSDARAMAYEIRMLRHCAHWLSEHAAASSPPDTSVYLECFLMHYGNLLEFFSGKGGGQGESKLAKPRDWMGIQPGSGAQRVKSSAAPLYAKYAKELSSSLAQGTEKGFKDDHQWKIEEMIRELEPCLRWFEERILPGLD